MEFFKRLFSGDGAKPAGGSRGFGGDPDGLYYYVQPNGCDEVVRVRVHRYNDLSERDEGGYWAHKLVRGSVCMQSAELDLYFDANRALTDKQVKGGALVDAAAYDAWTASQNDAT